MTLTFFYILVGATIVTWIPRILPFIFLRKIPLPLVITKWLTFIPVCIFTALIADSFIQGYGQINILALGALVPTALVALWTKSLSLTVFIGIISMALLRFLL